MVSQEKKDEKEKKEGGEEDKKESEATGGGGGGGKGKFKLKAPRFMRSRSKSRDGAKVRIIEGEKLSTPRCLDRTNATSQMFVRK